MKDKKIFLVITRIFGLVLSVILGYLFLTGGRSSRLVGFFVYMSIACTLIPLPTPPYVIGMGKIFHPVIVGLVGVLGTCLAAYLEYRLIIWLFSKIKLQQKVETNRFFQRFARFYNRAAFLCLVFAGFTPIPFEPFRFAAILTHYNMATYLLAIFVGRFPRYYLIAMFGHSYQIPDIYLIALYILLFLIPVITSFIEKFNSTRKISYEQISSLKI